MLQSPLQFLNLPQQLIANLGIDVKIRADLSPSSFDIYRYDLTIAIFFEYEIRKTEFQIFIRLMRRLIERMEGRNGEEFGEDFKVSNDSRWQVKFHLESYFYFVEKIEKTWRRGASIFYDMLRRIRWFFEFCLRRKEKGSKETNKQNCERTSAGQSLRKILYDTVEFPLRPVSRCFFKKKKKEKEWSIL